MEVLILKGLVVNHNLWSHTAGVFTGKEKAGGTSHSPPAVFYKTDDT